MGGRGEERMAVKLGLQTLGATIHLSAKGRSLQGEVLVQQSGKKGNLLSIRLNPCHSGSETR